MTFQGGRYNTAIKPYSSNVKTYMTHDLDHFKIGMARCFAFAKHRAIGYESTLNVEILKDYM